MIDGYRWNRVDDYGYVTVPYVIDASLPDTSRVTAAIAHVEARTDGILFVPRTNQTDYVRFLPWDTQLCQGSYGRQGGQQTVMLHSSCHVGRVIHELGHVLNMFHEHQRCDRDQYVEALFQGSAYDRVCDGASDLFDYNESSIMHYDDTINGVARFLSLRGRASEMGQRDSLATTDVWTINQMYPYLFAVSVGGPYLITEPGDYTWNAVAIGGNGTYTNYTWEIALDDAQTVWYAAGTGQSHTRTLSGPGVDRFYLRVRVSSDGRTTTSVPYAVTNAME